MHLINDIQYFDHIRHKKAILAKPPTNCKSSFSVDFIPSWNLYNILVVQQVQFLKCYEKFKMAAKMADDVGWRWKLAYIIMQYQFPD